MQEIVKRGRKPGNTTAKKAIRKADFEKLLDFVGKNKKMNHPTKAKLKIAFTLLYITGCRISEIKNFTSYDLKKIIDKKEFSLANNTKTKSVRLIQFSNTQIAILEKVLPKEDGYLFAKNGSKKPMTIGGLTSLCNFYIQKCLGNLYSSHGFRRNMITTILQTTGRVKLAQIHIGHKNSATTIRYDTPLDTEIKSTLNAINW